MDEVYFDKTIRFKQQAIEEDRTDLLNDPGQFPKIEGVYERLFRFQHHLWMAQYSRGAAIQDLEESFLLVVQAAEDLRRVDVRGVHAFNFNTTLDNYVAALWLLSQVYLLKVKPELVTRLLACIANEGEDLLLERLAAISAPDIRRKSAKKLLYPKAYQSLYDALDASAEQQATLMQQFLKGWYKAMSKTGWHNSHKGPGGGGFFGYWCWEAAGVAHSFGIDDSSFRDMPYYPKDLADFARTPKLT
ncbi:PoNe immunity protein domain-containing protein [Hymenobacter terrenus]|uniref:PoNe immunity protein domain-containing protein n=1 Tax=Hymenobacter terrenus TaxID=1629124 RepID=UPI000AB18B9D|nr:PoNe immunity protein domain-containing protein [Hymenobacter terrenus]